MTLTYIENLVTNFCFFILFFMMVFYWIKTSFFGVNLGYKKNEKFFQGRKTLLMKLRLIPEAQGKNPSSSSMKLNGVDYEKNSFFPKQSQSIKIDEKKYKMLETLLRALKKLNFFQGLETSFQNFIPFIGFYGIFFSNISLTILLILRWINSGHLPLSNLYESLLFLTWSITFIQIILEKISELEFVGILLCPLTLLIFSFASFSLPSELQNITPLVPALQSNWLLMHVSIMILSYGTLLCGCIFSITYLFLNEYNFQNNFKKIFYSSSSGVLFSLIPETSFQNKVQETKFQIEGPETKFQTSQSFETLEVKTPVIQNTSDQFFLQPWSALKQKVDNVSYRMISIGFSFLTIGILSGAVWANETWGSYWSWDPKETWAFITWLVFAIYLHSRLNYGWQGKKPAIIATIGFIIVWLCYLGVNLVGKGLHSYGWIQFS